MWLKWSTIGGCRHFGERVSKGKSQITIDHKGPDFLRILNFPPLKLMLTNLKELEPSDIGYIIRWSPTMGMSIVKTVNNGFFLHYSLMRDLTFLKFKVF
jgi:hypothetical protein